SGQNLFQKLGGPMELLRANDQIDLRKFVDELASSALSHAPQKTKHDVGPMTSRVRGQVLHFTDGLLFRGIAHTAGVQKNHVGCRLRTGQRVTSGKKLRGNAFRVALVHLTTVGLDINTGHAGSENGAELTRGRTSWKGQIWPVGFLARRLPAG